MPRARSRGCPVSRTARASPRLGSRPPARRRPPRRAWCRLRRRLAPSPPWSPVCVVNGRLRQAGDGAVRLACSARRNETPGGILPLRVCTVLPRGDPFVAVRTRDVHAPADAGAERVRCQPQHSRLAPPAGHAAAGCLPHGIPDGPIGFRLRSPCRGGYPPGDSRSTSDHGNDSSWPPGSGECRPRWAARAGAEAATVAWLGARSVTVKVSSGSSTALELELHLAHHGPPE